MFNGWRLIKNRPTGLIIIFCRDAACHVSTAYPFPCATYPFLCAAYSFLCATYPFLCATYPFLRATYPFLCAAYPFLRATYPFLCAAYPFLCAAYPFLCAAYPFLRAAPRLCLSATLKSPLWGVGGLIFSQSSATPLCLAPPIASRCCLSRCSSPVSAFGWITPTA